MQRYVGRVSGPILDRIDLHIEVPQLDARTLTRLQTAEPSETIRGRVLSARERQLKRFAGRPFLYANAHLGPRELREFCPIDDRTLNLLRTAVQRLGLSARAYHRILRLARTIADLAGQDGVAASHVAEAIQYRSLDRRRAEH